MNACSEIDREYSGTWRADSEESRASESSNTLVSIARTQVDEDPQWTLQRTTTNESYFDPRATTTSISSSLNMKRYPYHHSSSLSSFNPEKRKVDLQLPSFRALGISSSETSLAKLQLGKTPMLTPPPDVMELRKFDSLSTKVCSQDHRLSTSEPSDHTRSGLHPSHGVLSRRAVGSTLPTSFTLPEPTGWHGSAWIKRASQSILSEYSELSDMQQLQIVSQTMPSQARDSRTKPTFEDILEITQLEIDSVPYITITHAVPQVRTMQELPKTPPTTPNARVQTSDYFGEHQTIFTHGAVVPIYHDHGPHASATHRIPHFIAAPHSVQISILERYIPPTMPEEIADFFKSTSRSYLTDRLLELSPDNGSLMLVYPTRSGGRTFARDYIGPIIDPFLRQFVLLNNLTTDAAAALGTMSAVDSMLEYDEMRAQIAGLCEVLNQRPSIRGRKSSYQVTYHEKTEVILDRADWMNWYVEQEQSRLRQNLVEYHHAGGRMPGREGHREVTVGMLAREVIEGVQRSQAHAGGVGVEVGVFVIRSVAS